jgi:hypothetical protein
VVTLPSVVPSFSKEGFWLALGSGARTLIESEKTELDLRRNTLLGITGLIVIALPYQRRLWNPDRLRAVLYCGLPSMEVTMRRL